MRIDSITSVIGYSYVIQSRTVQPKSDEVSSILGGGKTNINGEIEDFKQGATGNCYMLTRLKNLSRKSWGKRAIKSAIVSDGMGGAYVTFKGATSSGQIKPVKLPVSVEDILRVRTMQQKYPDPQKYKLSTEAGQRQYEQDLRVYRAYSQGDDDVLVVELAYKKYLKSKGRNMSNGDTSTLMGNNAIMTDDGDIIRLIVGSKKNGYRGARFGTTNPVLMDRTLSAVKNRLDDYVLEIEFKEGNELGFPTNHSIEIVAFGTDSSGRPMIELRNPWDSSQPIKKGYYDVLLSARNIFVWENPDKKTNLSSEIQFANTTQEELNNLYIMQKKYQTKPGRVIVKRGWH